VSEEGSDLQGMEVVEVMEGMEEGVGDGGGGGGMEEGVGGCRRV
jgi:hypothetical protein